MARILTITALQTVLEEKEALVLHTVSAIIATCQNYGI